MGATKKNSNGVEYPSTSALQSPRGPGPSAGPCEQYAADMSQEDWDFILDGSLDPGDQPPDPDTMCWECGVLLNHDCHRSFLFYHSPRDIEHSEVMGGVPSEWRPCPPTPAIPGDQGPNRVAYWHHGEPVVQVHDGPDNGFWVPCSYHTVALEGLPYVMWICRRFSVQNPCDEEFMKEISS